MGVPVSLVVAYLAAVDAYRGIDCEAPLAFSEATDALDAARKVLDDFLALREPKWHCPICQTKKLIVHHPYCAHHAKMFDSEWKICRARGCWTACTTQYPFTCAKHNGQDYVPRTKEAP